jgi:hypothetical protein
MSHPTISEIHNMVDQEREVLIEVSKFRKEVAEEKIKVSDCEIPIKEKRKLVAKSLCIIANKLNIPNKRMKRDTEEEGDREVLIESDEHETSIDEDLEPVINKFVNNLTNHLSSKSRTVAAELESVTEELKSVNAELERVNAEMESVNDELDSSKSKYQKLVSTIEDKVECPICLAVPKKAPIYACPKGHLICQTCCRATCPVCSASMQSGGTSLLALAVIEKIPHHCDFQEHGCTFLCSLEELSNHQDECQYRTVKCPFQYCEVQVPLISLIDHSKQNRGGHRAVPFFPSPHKMSVSLNVLNDQDLSSRQKQNYSVPPLGIVVDEQHFFLKIIHDGIKGVLNFYVMMAGGKTECKDYSVTIKVFNEGLGEDGRHSVRFTGDICPIDIDSVSTAIDSGYCLSLSDSQMKNIFSDKFAFHVKIVINKESF